MFTDVTDLCDSEAEDGDLDLESTAFSDNTDFAERTLRTQGDVPQALGTVVCQTDLRRRLQGERHLVKQGGSTASAHLQGGSGRVGSGGHCVTTPEEGACHVGKKLYGEPRLSPLYNNSLDAHICVSRAKRVRETGEMWDLGNGRSGALKEAGVTCA